MVALDLTEVPSVPSILIQVVFQSLENFFKVSENVAEVFQAIRLPRIHECYPKLSEHSTAARFRDLRKHGLFHTSSVDWRLLNLRTDQSSGPFELFSIIRCLGPVSSTF